jgi:dynein heavy chain
VQIIRNRIHIVFCCSKDGERLRHYSRNYSAFIYNTTQIYYESWPHSALIEVATKFLSDDKLENTAILSKYFAYTHKMVSETAELVFQETGRKFCITQKNFVDFSLIFKQMLKHKRQDLRNKINKYINGLERLQEANENVDKIKMDMDLKRYDLDETKKKCEKMIQEIEIQKRESEKEKTNIKEQEISISKEKEKIDELAEEENKLLEKAMPIL